MIHDEGIEKAITWLSGLDVTKDRQVKMAIIGGLRELQTARTKVQSQSELIEKLEKAISEHMGYLASATGVPPQYVGLKSALYAVEAWRAGKEQK